MEDNPFSIKEFKLSQLKKAPYNPGEMLPDDYNKLKRSVKTWKDIEPIVFNIKTNEIIDGHHRLDAYTEQGIEKVYVLIRGDLGWIFTPEQIEIKDENQMKAMNVALRKIRGEFNLTKLQALTEDLKLAGFDVTLTGFDDNELKGIETQLTSLKEIKEDDYDPDKPVETKVNHGDLWKLGKHHLYCGDATKKEDINTLMQDQLADIIITDPPYNVNYTGATKDKLKIQNDNMDDEKFYQFLFDAYTNMYHAAGDGAAIYIFHSDTEGLNFRKAFKEAGFKLAQCLIWSKQSLVMGRQDYHWQHEPILYGWKPTGKHNWYSDRKQSTIWNFQKPTKNIEHPTMKPIELIAYPIKNSSKVGDIILDPFGGSGSTIIAAEQLGRIVYAMELDPHYCDIIINRWEEFTGEVAVLDKTG